MISCLILGASLGSLLSAPRQSPETIRGRVSDDSARAVVGATVYVTRGPDRLTQNTVTDNTGSYRMTFDQGTGDYLVYVTASGYKSVRRRIHRYGTESELIADFVLVHAPVVRLEGVTVAATKPVRASNPVGPMVLDPGTSERWQEGVNGQVSPVISGDLSALAGTMPNVTVTSGGVSILGSGPGSNLTTLNGAGFPAGSIPRAARTQTRITTATFDPTRGGFSGSNTDVRLGPGDRNLQNFTTFLTLEPSHLQFSDASARSRGAMSAGFRASVGADGELITRALTYNVALDVARRTGHATTLLSANPDALMNAGLSPDSVARLTRTSSAVGLPLSRVSIPREQVHDGLTWLGRFDDTRDTLQTRALTTYLESTNDGAVGFGTLSAPSTALRQNRLTFGGQLTHGAYVGPAHRVLTETRLAVGSVRRTATPYVLLPAANVLLSSPHVGASDLTMVNLGGGSFLGDDRDWTAEGSNLTMWNAGGRRHRFKALAWARLDGFRYASRSTPSGSFGFASISDLDTGRASSFSRTLPRSFPKGSVWNAALAFGDQFAPTKFFSMMFGARLDGDGFSSKPRSIPALTETFGQKTGAGPTKFHISPRVGFTYTYNRDKENTNGNSINPAGLFSRPASGVIRGGIGEFRNLLRSDVLAEASAGTAITLSCVGAAVPAVDWSRFDSDPASIPNSCLDGVSALSESGQSVSLIDPSYDVARSWRASVGWTTNYKNVLFKIGALGSYDVSRPGTVDRNFSGVQRFTLGSEGQRPVFVTTAGIDPATGTVSGSQSRISQSYGRVASLVSDLKGYAGQFTFEASPDAFKFKPRIPLFLTFAYSLQWSRSQYRGFDGAAFGDPRVREWAPSSSDARHVVVVSAGTWGSHLGALTLFGRLQSGLPFTPIVAGDINGDGRFGDRAFVPDPATVQDTALARQMSLLLENGTGIARECLSRMLGHPASRNGCRSPWSQTLNMQWQPYIPSRFSQRVTSFVYFQNILTSSQRIPDVTLLVPRSFDAAQHTFHYDVNQRFADSRRGPLGGREPFRVVIDFRFNFSVPYDLQQLRRAVEPQKTASGWQRRTADAIAAFYLRRTSNIHRALLDESDSLFLSRMQVAALQQADSIYSARVRALFIPLGELLEKSHGMPGKAELDSVAATQMIYWKIFWEQPEIAAAIVTPSQRELFPLLNQLLSVTPKSRLQSQSFFGDPVTLADKPLSPKKL